MTGWLAAFVSAIIALFKDVGSSLLAYFAGARQGRLQQKSDQDDEALDALRRAADAGAGADLSDDGLRDSKNNRDNK